MFPMLTLLSMFYYICLRRRSRSGTRSEALGSRRAVELGQRSALPITVEVEQYGKEVLDFTSHYGSENSMSYTCGIWRECLMSIPAQETSPRRLCSALTEAGGSSVAAPLHGSVVRRPVSTVRTTWKLAFEEPVYPTAVEVLETYHPGAIVKILACSLNPFSQTLQLM